MTFRFSFYYSLPSSLSRLIAGYDRNRLLDDEESQYPGLLERELRSLHPVPGLRRAGVDTNAIRQVSWSKIW
jgi:hypothetical protein